MESRTDLLRLYRVRVHRTDSEDANATEPHHIGSHGNCAAPKFEYSIEDGLRDALDAAHCRYSKPGEPQELESAKTAFTASCMAMAQVCHPLAMTPCH